MFTKMDENLKTINPHFQCFLKTRRGNGEKPRWHFCSSNETLSFICFFPCLKNGTSPSHATQPCTTAHLSQAPIVSSLSRRLLCLPCDLRCFPATTTPSLWPTLLPCDYRAVICGMDPICCELSSWVENA